MKSRSFPIEFEGYASTEEGEDLYFDAVAVTFEGELEHVEHDMNLTQAQEDDLLSQAQSHLDQLASESRSFSRALARDARQFQRDNGGW